MVVFSRICLYALALIASVLTFSSCTTTPSSTQIFLHQNERNVWLHSLKSWEVSGQFAIKKQPEGWSGYFEWKELSKMSYKIHFYGPFGAQNTYLIGKPNQVIWKDNQGIKVALTPEGLINEKTGFLFPVAYLHDWMVGRPAPNENVYDQKFDVQGRCTDFSQAGWYIHYDAYQPVGLGELPEKMVLYYQDIQIKIIIQTWKAH